MPVSIQQIIDKEFRLITNGKGYDPQEVDGFIDEIVD